MNEHNTLFPPLMIGLNETSERTGLSYDYLRKLCLRGEIVHIRTGKKYLINYPKLVEYLNTQGKEDRDEE